MNQNETRAPLAGSVAAFELRGRPVRDELANTICGEFHRRERFTISEVFGVGRLWTRHENEEFSTRNEELRAETATHSDDAGPFAAIGEAACSMLAILRAAPRWIYPTWRKHSRTGVTIRLWDYRVFKVATRRGRYRTDDGISTSEIGNSPVSAAGRGGSGRKHT